MVSTKAVESPSLKTRLAKLGVTIAAIWGGVYVIAAVGAPLEYSRRFLAEPLHLAVLLLYSVGLAYLLTWIFTERARSENSTRILVWFGPYGLVLLPLLIMATSALVLASFTATLFHHGWVELSPGSAFTVPGAPKSAQNQSRRLQGAPSRVPNDLERPPGAPWSVANDFHRPKGPPSTLQNDFHRAKGALPTVENDLERVKGLCSGVSCGETGFNRRGWRVLESRDRANRRG